MTSELAGARMPLETADGALDFYSLPWLAETGVADVSRLPHTVRILLENLLRRAGTRDVADEDVRALARWPQPSADVAFMPARVLMQDFTGVPAVVDLAAMRSAVARAGGDPATVNPLVPVDLIIDHSVQVDLFRSRDAYEANIDWEYRRNGERYALLRWAQQAFDGLRVVPPGAGICHQVNLEHLGQVVSVRDGVAFPDTLMGTDSHTTMVNGLGVLGWGVGGIEAEAAMLGQPTFLPQPDVVGVRVTGELPAGTTATDLVLTLTQMLRAHGVVGRFVEFFGAGLSSLTIADRATLSNMCPEYGATSAYFPVDARTLEYLRFTGRGHLTDRVERYTKAQGLFREDADEAPAFNETLELDLAAIEPSMAGPRRPQDRVALPKVWDRSSTRSSATSNPIPSRRRSVGSSTKAGNPDVSVEEKGWAEDVTPNGRDVGHGSVVIAAITSCTNTSNPSVMVAAGLLAKRAVEAGLESRPWVKTSLAPGSRVVTDYLDRAGLTPYLEKLGFNLVGYGCTTCIGNSGPLPDEVAEGGRRREAERGRRPVGQPELRRAHPPAGPSELPRVAAARRGLRPRRKDQLRSDDRAARRRFRGAGVPPRPLAEPDRGGRGDRDRDLGGPVRGSVQPDLGRRRALGRAADADRAGLRVGSRLDLRAGTALLLGAGCRPGRRRRGGGFAHRGALGSS